MDNGKKQFAERVIHIAEGLGHYWANQGRNIYQEIQSLLQGSPPEDPGHRKWIEAYAERVRKLLPEATEYIRHTPFEQAVLDPKGHRVLEAIHNADEISLPGIPYPSIQERLDFLIYDHETGGSRFRFHVEARRDPKYDAWQVEGWVAVQSPKGIALALEWKENPWGEVKGNLIPGYDIRYATHPYLRSAEGIYPGARHYDALLTLLEKDLAERDPVFQKLLGDFQQELKEGALKDLNGLGLKLAAGDLAYEASEASQKAKLLEEFFRDYASALRREDSYSLLARYAMRVAEELQQASERLAAVGEGLDRRIPGLIYPERESEVPALRRVLDLYREVAGISGGDGLDRGMRDRLALVLEPHVYHLTEDVKKLEEKVTEFLAAFRDHQASLGLYVRETLSFPPNTESDPEAYRSEEERRKALQEEVLSEKRVYVRDDSFLPDRFFYSKEDWVQGALASLKEVHTALDNLEAVASYREEVRVGVNGNLHEHFVHPVAHLEYGGVVAYGSFSGQTGYSGHWDELRLGYDHEAQKYVLLAKVNETDTSHRNPDIILEEPIGDWGDFREKLVRVGKVQEAYETLYELVRPSLRELYSKANAVEPESYGSEDRNRGDYDLD